MLVWGRRLGALPPRVILVIGYAAFVLYGFPGYMSTDSVAQLAEARTGLYTDGHPPLMAAEWHLLDLVISGPVLMLLLQGALFLGGLYVLLQRVLAPRAAAWTAIGILLFPPVLTTMTVIWKDSQMAAYLIAGIAALVQPRLAIRLAGLGLLLVACALRHNAVAACVPLVAILFQWPAGIRGWKRIAILVGLAGLIAGATCGVSRVLAVSHVRLTPAFADIVGILAFTHDRTDEELREELRGTPLVVTKGIQFQARFLYYRRGGWRITQREERLFNYPKTDAEWDALNRVWRDLAFEDPVAYLWYHWDGFSRLLGADDEPLRAPVWNLFLETEEQMPVVDHWAAESVAQKYAGIVFTGLAEHTPLFRPYVYALVALCLLVLCCRDRLTLALFTSGLLYEASFFPVAAEPDYRYSHWMVTAVVVASVLLFVQRRRGRTT